MFSVDISSSELLQNRVTRRRHDILNGGCKLIPVSAVQSEYRDEESLQEHNVLNCTGPEWKHNSKFRVEPEGTKGEHGERKMKGLGEI